MKETALTEMIYAENKTTGFILVLPNNCETDEAAEKISAIAENYPGTVWEEGKFMHGKLIRDKYTTFDETSLCIWFDNDNYLNFACDVTLAFEEHWMLVKNLYDNTTECPLIAGVYEEDPE